MSYVKTEQSLPCQYRVKIGRFCSVLTVFWGVLPAGCTEVFAAVIRWHRLRRGGATRSESKSNDRRGRSHHNSTAISRPPTWQISGQNRYTPTKPLMLQICHVPTLCRRIAFANVRYCIVGAKRRRYFPMGEITGRLIAVELWCDRPRRSLDFDPLHGAPPLRTQRNFRLVIRWHSLRRGG